MSENLLRLYKTGMVVLINFYRTTIKEPVIITRIKRGVDKTRNKEHSGTSRNIPEHEKNKSNFHGKKIIIITLFL